MCTTFSSGSLVAPSAHHRPLWGQRVRERRLNLANRLIVVGMPLLLPTIAVPLFAITDMIFGYRSAPIVTVTIAAFLANVWFLMAIRDRLRDDG